MSEIERVAQEIRQRQESLKRFRLMVEEADKPRVEACRREFERAKRALEDAENSLQMGQGMVMTEEDKLNSAYADYFKTSTR